VLPWRSTPADTLRSAQSIQQLRQHVLHLDQKIDRFREELSARIDGLDQKVDRFREELSGEIRTLDQKFSRWFAWLTGILVTALLAEIGLLGAALFRR
jgi:uncharacterized protein YPO0396